MEEDRKDKFLSEEDLDLKNISWEEVVAYWNYWLEQAQSTNDLDKNYYSHGVFRSELLTELYKKIDTNEA